MIGTLAMHVAAANVADELRTCRLKSGHTQTSLAHLLGVSRRSVVRWEAGKGHLHKIYLTRIRELGNNAPVDITS